MTGIEAMFSPEVEMIMPNTVSQSYIGSTRGFIAQTRALLLNRLSIEEAENIQLTITTNSIGKDVLDKLSPGLIVVIGGYVEIVDIDTYHKDELISKYLSQKYNGKDGSVDCYTDGHITFVILPGENIDLFTQHLTPILPKLMPDWFVNPLTEEEQQYLKDVSERRTDKVSAFALEAYRAKGLEQRRIDAVFESFVPTDSKEVLLNRVNGDIAHINEQIESLQRQMNNEITKLREKQKLSEALLLRDDVNEKQEYKDYFRSHKNITVIRASAEGLISYQVDETLNYYDRDLAQKVIDTNYRRSVVYPVLKYVFVDNLAEINVTARFDLHGGIEARAIDIYTLDTSIPHPHLSHYHCFGENAGYIEQAMRDGDWMSAVEQTIAATKNIYWGDSVVVNEFVNDLTHHRDLPVISMPDGRVLSCNEVLRIIQEEEDERK